MKHTPTPWSYTGNVDYSNVQKSQLILQHNRTNAANIAKVIPCAGMTAEEVEANAKRIVDCVNACAGMDYPLERITELRDHRKRLLDVLKLCRSVIEEGGMFERSEQIAFEEASVVIAEIE
jgi:hypothetical protein